MRRLILTVLVACASAPPPVPPPPAAPWRLPAGWKDEVIPFPLEFAPQLAHRGVEELRFAPGFLDEHAAARWSYAFAWRLDDPAALDAPALEAELTAYFRGLLGAVDGDKHRLDPAQVIVKVAPDLTIAAHLIDTFHDASPVEVTGRAQRIACGGGAVWTFVLAPAASPVRGELEVLVHEVSCGQPVHSSRR
jgi:hypothetical protein